MKVCFFTADFSGAGCYRCLFPGQELTRQFGHECFVPEPKEVAPGKFMFDIGRQGSAVPAADVYVLQQRPEREWLRIIPALRDRGKIVVCETDDYYLGIPAWHPAFKITRGLVKDLHHIYGLADAMTVSTPFLAERYGKYNESMHLLPNFWDREMWAELPPRDWDRLRVGWMGVAGMRPQDLEVLRQWIGPWLRRHRDVDFVAAGDPGVHDLLDIPVSQRVSLPRVHFPQTPSLMQFDIGLVPLSKHDFNDGKSYLKGMEYNIAGIPYVASPRRSYREYTREGVNGFLAYNYKDWVRHLDVLAEDRGLLERLRGSSRAVSERFTIQQHAYRWNEVYSSLLGDPYDQYARDAIDRGALQKPEECAGFLRLVASRGAPRVVVEIGTAQGGMLHALAQIATQDALIVSIDLPGGDLDETSTDDKYGARDTDKMAAYVKEGQHVEFLQMDSHDRATKATLERILQGREVDLLFIDGDHSYDGVKRDFEDYRDLVRPGGVIGFHDIEKHYEQEWVEVDRFWDDIKNSHNTREFRHPGNWGWGPWGGIGAVITEEAKVAA